MLHKGFYDLLALATPSRLFAGAAATASKFAAGPRYENINPGTQPVVVTSAADVKKNIPPKVPPPAAATPLRKDRKISKDSISSPTGFV
jgi:protein-serine/threonine kinase